MSESKANKVILLSAGLLLCLAVIPVWSYSYYVVLRIAVCGAAAYTVYQLRSRKDFVAHKAALIVIAVLFNPFIPVYLSRALWLPIDLGVAVYFLKFSKKL